MRKNAKKRKTQALLPPRPPLGKGGRTAHPPCPPSAKDGEKIATPATSARREEKRPRVLLFTGDGKGKTTAALGLVLRACGHRLPALIIQFLKADARTGEIAASAQLPGVKLIQAGRGFLPPPTSPSLAAHRAAAQRGLAQAASALAKSKYEVVVLDEICTAVEKGLLEEKAVAAAIARAAAGKILVLTGRGATPGLLELADTVTEMRCLMHGYQKGIKAQRGVEY